jgi:hypothetical protein
MKEPELDDDCPPVYEVRLLIRHPNIDPDRITKTLGLIPHSSAMAGSERRTLAGDLLPGLHKDSAWSYSFRVTGNRRLFSDAAKLIDKLEPHQAFLAELDHGGGSICFILDLPGDVNMGDVLPWRDMARLANLHIDLGIEVFPNFN